MTTTTPAMRILSVEPLATVRRTTFDAVTAEVDGYRAPWRCGLVRRPDAVAVLPYDLAQGVYILVRQPRIGLLGGTTLEAPAGVLDHPLEGSQKTAERELAEECGLAAQDYTLAFEDVYATPGYSDERISGWLSQGLTEVPSRPEDGYIQTVRFPLDDIFEHIEQYRRSPEADMKTLLLMMALAARL